jgi:glucokinase
VTALSCLGSEKIGGWRLVNFQLIGGSLTKGPGSTRLIGDVGGTNARFGWQTDPAAPLTLIERLPCADFESIDAAIQTYLNNHGLPTPRSCAIGIATPITGDRVQMTNHHWSFSISALKNHYQFEQFMVINDFTALALALPEIARSELHQIGPGAEVEGSPKALIGAGTGLGVSGLIPGGKRDWVPISGEGGHVSLSAQTEEEAAVIAHLRAGFGHVSAERVLSGPGLVNLYNASAAIDSRSPAFDTPEKILQASDSDPDCKRAVQWFCAFLGSVAGDLALTLGARGGVYIGGGIAPRLLAPLEVSMFRARFEDKGRFRSYLSTIPTSVIVSEHSPALIGAARALER